MTVVAICTQLSIITVNSQTIIFATIVIVTVMPIVIGIVNVTVRVTVTIIV